jgi:anthranilate synthase component 1
LQALFDIAGDLDTPVSAYMKLAAFEPRFLLESVEGGERLARYSFIGLGTGLEVRLDERGLAIGSKLQPLPATGTELLAGLRSALQAAPRPEPDIAGVPLAGGLVGYAAYDVVRFFERLPLRPGRASGVPALHYVAPRSVLVFDHLTRGIALVHAGTEDERRSLRKEVVRALRGALPNGRRAGRYAPAAAAWSPADYMAGVQRTQEYIAAGDVYQLVLASRFSGRHELDPFQAYRALRLINPSPYIYYCALGEVAVVGSSPEALVKLNGRRAQLRPIGAQRPRTGGAGRQRARRALPLDRALQSRHAHGERRARGTRSAARRV